MSNSHAHTALLLLPLSYIVSAIIPDIIIIIIMLWVPTPATRFVAVRSKQHPLTITVYFHYWL